MKLYTLPEAVDVVAERIGSSFSVDELVRYAKDGTLYFSVIFDRFLFYEFYENSLYINACADCHDAGKDFENIDLEEIKSETRDVVEEMEEYSFSKLIVYLPPDHDAYGEAHHMFGCTQEGWVMPIMDVLVSPENSHYPVCIFDPQIKWNGKITGFVGAFILDQDAKFGDHSGWFNGIEEAVEVLEIVVTQQQLDNLLSQNEDQEQQEPFSEKWEEITVSLLANHRIALKSDDDRREFSMFDLGLMDKRTTKPNVSGRTLVRLSERRKYPLGRIATEAEKNVMKKLRASLKLAANMKKNPFATPNASDGWKPRFTLIDSRNAADVRARQRAIQVPYDDSRGYEQENDAAGDFLLEHDE